MKFLQSYGDDKPKLFKDSIRYYVESGLRIPDFYLKENLAREKVLDDDLLKTDVDIIIAKTPVYVLPFGWGIHMREPAVTKATVTQFYEDGPFQKKYKQEAFTRRVVPRNINLEVNDSLEMIEPDLSYKGILEFFRALSDQVVVGFKIDEDVGPFEKGRSICVRIKRFYP